MSKITYEAVGVVKVIGDTQTFANDFTKREIVITTPDDKYPQDVKFEVIKDKCKVLDVFNIGQEVKIFFDLRGNEYSGKHYVNLAAWRIDALSQASNEEQAQPTGSIGVSAMRSHIRNEEAQADTVAPEEDNIPF
tara:strand:+ start:744 stop:1148 length:405 start_codon:yes stop_codon:yes gene_type:complete